MAVFGGTASHTFPKNFAKITAAPQSAGLAYGCDSFLPFRQHLTGCLYAVTFYILHRRHMQHIYVYHSSGACRKHHFLLWSIIFQRTAFIFTLPYTFSFPKYFFIKFCFDRHQGLMRDAKITEIYVGTSEATSS